MISVLELERAVIASAIREQNANTIDVIEKLEPEHFESRLLASFWKTIKMLHKQNEPIDGATLATTHEDEWPVIQNLMNLSGISPVSIKAYAKKVRQTSNLRNAVIQMRIAIESIENCSDAKSIGSVALDVEKAFSLITLETDNKLPRSGAEILPEYINMIEARHEGHDSEKTIKFGIDSLDEMLGGLNPVDLVAIGGCSGMGKTELLIRLCNGVVGTGNAVLNFTMEMDEFQIVERSIADLARVQVGKLRSPKGMSQEDWGNVSTAMGEINNDLYWVHDEASISVEKICGHARAIKNKQPKLSLIIVDYAQIMDLPKSDSTNEAIGVMTRTLKKLAKELRCPVILLSQLNEKQIKERKDKRPINGDFYGSSHILNDSDRVFYVYRDDVYHDHSNMKGIAEIIVGKNRFGETGTIYQKWTNGHFVDIDQKEIANQIAQNEADERERQSSKSSNRKSIA